MIRRILHICIIGQKLLVLGALVAGFALLEGTVAQALELTVTSTTDAVDARPGDGVCATSTGTCTLRAAIQETNARGGPDTIVLQPGIYTLTIEGEYESTGATGDLDITDALTIKGMGAQDTRIDGNKLDRVFDIRVGDATEVHIEGVTITGGDVFEEGSGIRATGRLTIRNSSITANVSSAAGGGIIQQGGTLTIIGSNITANTAADGGGVYNQGGKVTLRGTTIKDNKPDDCSGCQ